MDQHGRAHAGESPERQVVRLFQFWGLRNYGHVHVVRPAQATIATMAIA